MRKLKHLRETKRGEKRHNLWRSGRKNAGFGDPSKKSK